jgi:multicomponent Na+:H+ antiporter subunit G
MSSVAADLVIFPLLFLGVMFGGISLLGLLIFPDIRSRMYTALRAGLISAILVIAAGAVFALARLAESGGSQYQTFLFHALFLCGLIIVGTMILSRQILEKTHAMAYCVNPPGDSGTEKKEAS